MPDGYVVAYPPKYRPVHDVPRLLALWIRAHGERFDLPSALGELLLVVGRHLPRGRPPVREPQLAARRGCLQRGKFGTSPSRGSSISSPIALPPYCGSSGMAAFSCAPQVKLKEGPTRGQTTNATTAKPTTSTASLHGRKPTRSFGTSRFARVLVPYASAPPHGLPPEGSQKFGQAFPAWSCASRLPVACSPPGPRRCGGAVPAGGLSPKELSCAAGLLALL